MRKYFFKTQRFKWLLVDICAWLVCIVIADLLWYLPSNFHIVTLLQPVGMVASILPQVNGIMAKLAVLILSLLIFALFIIMIVLCTFPLLAIYYGITRAIRKNQKARMRYDVISGMDYYRDEFKDLSPVDISLLADLKIERRKDVTATLLSLEQKKWIHLYDGKIEFIPEGGEPLLYSEKELLQLLKTKQINAATLAQWEQLSIKDAVKKGLLINSRSPAKLLRKLLFFVALFIFSLIAFNKAKASDDELEQYDALIAIVEEEQRQRYAEMGIDIDTLPQEEQKKLFLEQLETPEIQQALVIISMYFMMALCGLLAIILPFITIIYLITYAVSHSASRAKYKRTRRGKILTEELAAMRNFIHDFSNLKDADKSQLILWNNFLVYAVVLEENQSIVEEIGRAHNWDVSKYNFVK